MTYIARLGLSRLLCFRGISGRLVAMVADVSSKESKNLHLWLLKAKTARHCSRGVPDDKALFTSRRTHAEQAVLSVVTQIMHALKMWQTGGETPGYPVLREKHPVYLWKPRSPSCPEARRLFLWQNLSCSTLPVRARVLWICTMSCTQHKRSVGT